MLNLHPNIICPSEEPFALYFYNKYKHKTKWTNDELVNLVDEFWLMAEQSLELYFTSKQKLFNELVKYKDELNYKLLCDVIYMQFYEPKPKEDVNIIIDKQIKYFFCLKKILKIFPDAKFIILVRDPKVNAVSKKNRNLNIGKNPLYLAALWNNTYKNISYLESKHKSVLVIKYEDLVSDPSHVLKKICNYIGITYIDNLVDTEGVFETFLDLQKHKLSTEELNYLKDFHSSLFKKINQEKIHLQKNELDPELHDKIVKLTQPLLIKYNYPNTFLNSKKIVVFSLSDYWQIIISYFYRPILLLVYFRVPLFFKLKIKKIKNYFSINR